MSCSTLAGVDGDSDLPITSLEAKIPALMHEAGIPGVSIALIDGGRTVWARGFGVKRAGAEGAVDAGTVFEGASFSKPLFAYAVLQLARQGMLDLDTPLAAYLPDLSFCPDSRSAAITARMVLSHTSGFPNWRRHGEPLTLDRTPGERFGYSGEGYVYLQQAVERLTGRPLHESMEKMVLAPLGMTSSSYVWRQAYEAVAATGHKGDGTPYQKERPADANAAASLHTTPADFARFLIDALSGSGEMDSDAMLAPQVEVAGNLRWGLGWGLQRDGDDEIIWHWGDNPGFTNFAATRKRERSGMVLMTNSDNGLRLWRPLAHQVLGLDSEIFDWLASVFYGAERFAEARLR